MTEIINKIDIENKFKCDRCDHSCSIKSNLNKHIKQIHDKIKEQYQDDKSVISYAIILYLIFFIQVSNILIYYIRNIVVSPIIKNENMMFNNGLYYTLKYKTTNNIV
jgi:hypothetical protein